MITIKACTHTDTKLHSRPGRKWRRLLFAGLGFGGSGCGCRGRGSLRSWNNDRLRGGEVPQSVAEEMVELDRDALVHRLSKSDKGSRLHFRWSHGHDADSHCMLLALGHDGLHVLARRGSTTTWPLVTLGSILPPAEVMPGHITLDPPRMCLIPPLSHCMCGIMYGSSLSEIGDTLVEKTEVGHDGAALRLEEHQFVVDKVQCDHAARSTPFIPIADYSLIFAWVTSVSFLDGHTVLRCP